MLDKSSDELGMLSVEKVQSVAKTLFEKKLPRD
jgi:hypothetical protein